MIPSTPIIVARERRITGHEINPANSAIGIHADALGTGGASHRYVVVTNEGKPNAKGHMINFQDGPVGEDGNGVNGLTHEVLLTIVADRLESFQAGPYACQENSEALAHVRAALGRLHDRTRNREARGVEGTHKV